MNKSIVIRKRIELNQAMISKRLRLRLSRTGGVSAAWHPFRGVTFNTQHGFRLSKTRKGLTLGIQSGRFVIRGRWNLGKYFRLNLAKKRGFSLSWKNELGSLNLSRPQYSSAKLFGIQLRGQRAASIQRYYLLFRLIVWAVPAMVLASVWLLMVIVRLQKALAIISFFVGQAFHLLVDWFVYLGRVSGVIVSAFLEFVWLELRVLLSSLWQILGSRFSLMSKKPVYSAEKTQKAQHSITQDHTVSEVKTSHAKPATKRSRSKSLYISPTMSVSQLQQVFKETLKLHIRIYHGRRIAEPTVTLNEISKSTWTETAFKVSVRSKVKSVEDSFTKIFGVKIKILDMNGNLAGKDGSIADSRI
jgi:hypothetical protein